MVEKESKAQELIRSCTIFYYEHFHPPLRTTHIFNTQYAKKEYCKSFL